MQYVFYSIVAICAASVIHRGIKFLENLYKHDYQQAEAPTEQRQFEQHHLEEIVKEDEQHQ